MEVKTLKKGQIVFKQGDPGDCMYDICWGRVGVYADYGTEKEKRIAELASDEFFGEMGLLDKAPRSATVVVLEDGTQLASITEDDFLEFFEKKPVKAFMILEQLSQRLRKTTKDYLEVCRVVHESVEAEKSGVGKPLQANDQISRILEAYRNLEYMLMA